MHKRILRHMQTAKAQISMCIRAVWSGPWLPADRIIGHYRIYQWKANAQMRFCACPGWCVSSHFAHARRHFFLDSIHLIIEPAYDKTNNMACAPSEDSDQPGHPPYPIRVCCALNRLLRTQAFSCGQQRLWSDWADAQADLSLRWAHMPFCWFCHALAHLLQVTSL